MRVLLVAHHLPPDGAAGVERLVHGLSDELRRAGDTVAVVSRRLGGGAAPRVQRETMPGGTVHYRLAGGTRPFDNFLAHHERLELLFGSILAEFDPEILHVHHLFGLSPRFIQLAHRLRTPTVVSLHDFYFACPRIVLRKPSGELCAGPDGGRECARTCYAGNADGAVRWGLREAYFHALLRLPERLIAPSPHMASFFERFLGDARRLRVVENGVSLERRLDTPSLTPLSRGRLNLAYLGTVTAHKGIHVLVEALRIARLPAVSLLVAGEHAEAAYVDALRQSASEVPGLRLTLRSAYEPEELPELLADADCVVMPSQWPETFGIVAREALVRGVPIIVSRVGGLADAVSEGRNGFTFASDRPQELAELLRRLTEDDKLVQRLREGARNTRVSSTAEHAAATRAVYAEATAAQYRPELDELPFLHETAVHMGFAAA
jgi:glycosyltransferase involved in cell wall biosynthesis